MSIFIQTIDYTRGPHKIAMRAAGCQPLTEDTRTRLYLLYGYTTCIHVLNTDYFLCSLLWFASKNHLFYISPSQVL